MKDKKKYLEEEYDYLIAGIKSAKLDYIEFFNPNTLESVKRVERGTHMALAVYLGKTRLIDNSRL